MTAGGAIWLLVLFFRKSGECIRANILLETSQTATAEKIATLENARVRLSEEFRLLSQEALTANTDSFLQLARGDFDEKRKTIAETLQPVSEQLLKFQEIVHAIEKERHGAYSELKQQIGGLAETQGQLRLETANLVKALRSPHTRGRWGEITLRRVVELAGMKEHCDFSEQVSKQTENGRLRPDLLIHLPGGKNIVVDSKVAIEAYLRALEAPDESMRGTELKNHARQVRTHIESLAAKSYWSQFDEAPDLVIMFLPLETAFSAAVENDPAMLEWAVERRVIPASPMTLIALLQAVHYGWSQEKMSQQARHIGTLGRELHDRIATFSDHYVKIGKHLNESVKAYNESLGSLESRVLTQARKLKIAGAGSADKTVAELQEITTMARANPLENLPE